MLTDRCGKVCNLNINNEDYKILGRELILSDILLAFDKTYPAIYTLDTDGEFCKWINSEESVETGVYWNLKENYDGQSDEVKQFLTKLLIGKSNT